MQEDEESNEPAIPGTENWPCSKRNSVFISSGQKKPAIPGTENWPCSKRNSVFKSSGQKNLRVPAPRTGHVRKGFRFLTYKVVRST